MPDFGDLDADQTVATTADSHAHSGADGTPGIEVSTLDVSNEEWPHEWAAVDVYTERRIYRMNSALTCIQVIDRASNKPYQKHDLIGRRLSGGQRKLGSAIWLCHPLPIPGTVAVFVNVVRGQRHFAMTSPVERVVVRVGSLVVPPDAAAKTWHALPDPATGSETAADPAHDTIPGRAR